MRYSRSITKFAFEVCRFFNFYIEMADQISRTVEWIHVSYLSVSSELEEFLFREISFGLKCRQASSMMTTNLNHFSSTFTFATPAEHFKPVFCLPKKQQKFCISLKGVMTSSSWGVIYKLCLVIIKILILIIEENSKFKIKNTKSHKTFFMNKPIYIWFGKTSRSVACAVTQKKWKKLFQPAFAAQSHRHHLRFRTQLLM